MNQEHNETKPDGHRSTRMPVGRAMALIATALTCHMAMAAGATNATPAEQAVTYKTIGVADYQNFLKNWDEKQQPALYALIQTPAQYDALFHPAPVMGGKRPFAPAADIYSNEQILVVARVMPAPANMDTVFQVERVVEKGNVVELHYRFTPPSTNATCSVKNFLAIRIPKRAYQKATFVENGKQVGDLNLADGQWAVPVPAQ